MPPGAADVRKLLMSLFDMNELRIFLSDHADYADIEDSVTWTDGFTRAADDVADNLDRRGLLNTDLRDRLIRERPGRTSDIEAALEVEQPAANAAPTAFAGPTPVAAAPGSPPGGEPWWRSPALPWDQEEPRQALNLVTQAYPDPDEITFVADTAGISRGEYVTSGSGRQVWRSLFEYAARSGKMPVLLERVLDDEHKAAFHPKLERVLGDLSEQIDAASLARADQSARVRSGTALVGLGGTLELADDAPTAGLQAIVDAKAGLGDPLAYIAGIANAMRRTAMIEVGGRPRGTGFMIGERHLLTNAHVLRAFGEQPPEERTAVAVFDFYSGSYTAHAEMGRRVNAGYVAHSPPTRDEQDGNTSDWNASTGFLDYCVLLLDEPVGAQPAGALLTSTTVGAPARGWFAPSTLDYDFSLAGFLVIVQHPVGEHQVMSRATPSFLVNGNGTRVRYNANTLRGSSGSAVIDERGRLVALHHYGLRGANQGIPIASIAADLRDDKDLDALVSDV